MSNLSKTTKMDKDVKNDLKNKNNGITRKETNRDVLVKTVKSSKLLHTTKKVVEKETKKIDVEYEIQPEEHVDC
jgi:hypothetical protein